MVVQTNDEFGRHFTSMDGRKLASSDDIIARMIRDGLFVATPGDGLFAGHSQTYRLRP